MFLSYLLYPNNKIFHLLLLGTVLEQCVITSQPLNDGFLLHPMNHLNMFLVSINNQILFKVL